MSLQQQRAERDAAADRLGLRLGLMSDCFMGKKGADPIGLRIGVDDRIPQHDRVKREKRNTKFHHEIAEHAAGGASR